METSPKLLVCIGDTHCGSTSGLLPPGCVLSEGNVPSQNHRQQWLWDRWGEFWEYVGQVAGDDEYSVLLNGDLTEGVHHGTTEIVSAEPSDHFAIAEMILAPIVERASRVFIIRGTECHTRNLESGLARLSGSPMDGARALDRLYLTINGLPAVFSHHIGTTSRAQLEATQFSIALGEEQLQAAKAGQPVPKIIGRAHRHVGGVWQDDSGLCFVTPPWQLKTRFAQKVVPASRMSVGGVILDWRHMPLGELPNAVLWTRTLPPPKGFEP